MRLERSCQTRVVRNLGTLTVTAGSRLNAGGGTLVNGGSMTVAGGWTLDAGVAVPSPFAFTNTGTLDKTGGTGQSLVASDVALGGTVRVRAGTLRFAHRAASARSQSADVAVDTGAAVDLMNGAFPFVAGSVTGGGALRTTGRDGRPCSLKQPPAGPPISHHSPLRSSSALLAVGCRRGRPRDWVGPSSTTTNGAGMDSAAAALANGPYDACGTPGTALRRRG